MRYDNFIALIPARSGSVRVKNKNLYILNGKSLLERKIIQLKQCGIHEIYVGSDSKEILDIADKTGAIAVKRSNVACDEKKSSANTMIKDFSEKVNSNKIAIWAHCTNPFIYSEHYIEAIEQYIKLDRDCFDSLLSVNKIQSHLWNHNFKPLNYDPWGERHPLASELSPVFSQDGGIFIQKLENFKNNSYFFGKKPYLFELHPITSFDLNTPDDMVWAQMLSKSLDKKYKFK